MILSLRTIFLLNRRFVALLVLLLAAMPLAAQTCTTGNELDAATHSALESTARQYFNMAVRGDVFNLRQAAIPAIANDFTGIERAVLDNKAGLTGGQPSVRNLYLLDAPGTAPIASAEFYCGIFGASGQTPNSAGFRIPNLPPGRYAVAIMETNGSTGAYMLTQVLQQIGGTWKLAGFYAKPTQIGGHDVNWFINQARTYLGKGQSRDAFFYLMQARELAAPVPFMSTLQLERLYDEADKIAPKDLPVSGSPVNLVGPDGRSWQLMSAFPVVVDGKLNLVVKYQSPDVSDTTKTFQDNTAIMRALVARYPEFREAFEGLVARAVTPGGQDYGTLLAMKDIK